MSRTTDVLTVLIERGPMTTTALAEALETTPDQTGPLLNYITSTGRTERGELVGQVRCWAITDQGRAFLDDFGQPRLIAGSLSHQLLTLASREPQTAREFQVRLEKRTGLDSHLGQISNKLSSLTERALLEKGAPRPVPHAPAVNTYALTAAGEDELDRLLVPA